MKYQTLHCHTTTSDGLLTHEQVLDECAKNNIGVVAFTDHDSVPKPETFFKLKNLKHAVKFISGIEISANYVKEVEGQIGNFHMVGLFVDPSNKKLIDYCKLAQEKRVERAKRLLNNLLGLGFNLTMEEINKYAGGETVGRPHIAKAILAKEQNLRIIDDLLEKLKKASSGDNSLTELYNHAVAGDYWQRMFDLFLDSKSFVKGIYVHYLNPTSLDDATEVIRQAGGVSLLGHWTFYKNKVPAELVEKFCQEKRIDGLETVYAFDLPIEEKPKFVADMQFLEGLVKKYELVPGGGGDFHRKEDFALMLRPDLNDYAERTEGLVERILGRHPNIDKTWTTL